MKIENLSKMINEIENLIGDQKETWSEIEFIDKDVCFI